MVGFKLFMNKSFANGLIQKIQRNLSPICKFSYLERTIYVFFYQIWQWKSNNNCKTRNVNSFFMKNLFDIFYIFGKEIFIRTILQMFLLIKIGKKKYITLKMTIFYILLKYLFHLTISKKNTLLILVCLF